MDTDIDLASGVICRVLVLITAGDDQRCNHAVSTGGTLTNFSGSGTLRSELVLRVERCS